MKRLIKQEEDNKPRRKIIRIVKFVVILFLLFFALEILMVNRLSTYGDKIQDLKNTQASLELENQILEYKISERTSLQKIESKASLFGFNSRKNIEYLQPVSLASAQ